LVAKEEGLADIRLIAKQATNHLNDNGYLLFEHGFEQGKQVQEILNQYGYCEIKTVKDYGNNDRVTIGLWRAS
jgi:release factor glutamine methyltransferase